MSVYVVGRFTFSLMQYGFVVEMVESFNTLIYNVKGLQNKSKRLQIFDFCKDKLKNNGLVMLQETHSCKRDEKVWKKNWNSDLFQNHGTSNSRGVMIGFSERFEKKI